MRPSFNWNNGDKDMTPKGAAIVIDSIDLRIFEIDEIQSRLAQEKEQLRTRRNELTQVRDRIDPNPIVSIG